MSSTRRQIWRGICLTVLCLLAGRAWADHVTMNDMLGLGYSTNPRIQHRNDIKGVQSTWAATHSPTVEVFVLSTILSSAQASAPRTAPVVSTAEKIAIQASEDPKPTPQPRPRLKVKGTTDADALIRARDQRTVELGVKERAFLQKFAADVEARCVFMMARDKIEPVAGMTVQYIVEIAIKDGAIAIKRVTSPSNVATPDYFISIMQALSPLTQPDPELAKTFGDVLRLEVTLS